MAIFNSKLLVYQRVWIQKHAVDLQWFCWSFNSSILPIRGQHCLQNLLHYSGPGSQDFAPYSNHGRLWKSEKNMAFSKKTIKILLFVYPRLGKRYEKIWKDLDWPSTIPQVTQVVNLGWDMTISCRSKTLQFVVSKLEQIQVLSGNVTSPLRITMFQTSW